MLLSAHDFDINIIKFVYLQNMKRCIYLLACAAMHSMLNQWSQCTHTIVHVRIYSFCPYRFMEPITHITYIYINNITKYLRMGTNFWPSHRLINYCPSHMHACARSYTHSKISVKTCTNNKSEISSSTTEKLHFNLKSFV